MARSLVGRNIAALGAQPELRAGFTTDNGNIILDVHNLSIKEPIGTENRINNIVGVVTNGLFAARPAAILLVGAVSGVNQVRAK